MDRPFSQLTKLIRNCRLCEAHLQHVQLTLIIGQYALKWHCGGNARKNLTETVRAWRDYGPQLIPLPHPSPRNNRWLQKNPWFEEGLVPDLRGRIRALLG